MFKVVFKIIGLVAVLAMISCNQTKKIAVFYPIDFASYENEIRQNIDSMGFDHINLYRSITALNKSSYFLYIDSNGVFGAYKVGTYRVSHYFPIETSMLNSFRYFDKKPLGGKDLDIQAVIEDSIIPNDLWYSNEFWFSMKIAFNDVIFEKSGQYRLLRSGQPIEAFLTEIERDILNIEQEDDRKWVRIDTP